MTLLVGRLRLPPRAVVLVGAGGAGLAGAALSPDGSAPVWTAVCVGVLAAINGYAKTASP